MEPEDTSAPDRTESTGDLFARAMRTLRRQWAEAAAPFGLSPHQVRALRVIGDGPLRAGEVADRLRIAPRSATDVIDALEVAQLITRQPDPGDRRAVIIDLSPRGHDVLDDVLAARHTASEEWLARLTPADRAELHRLLSLLQ